MTTQTQFDISILRENSLLDETQSQSIRSTLVLQNQTLSWIDSRKTLLEQELYDLELQRQAVSKERFFNWALLAPLRRMPAEVLGEIFKQCVELDGGWTLFEHPWEKHSPTLLTHICHRWREVAHGTPALWTNIHLDDFLPGQQRFVRFWLQNSGSLPLNISVYLWDLDYHLTPDQLVGVQSLIGHHHRIRSVRINAHPQIVETILGARDFPLLQELWLHYPAYHYGVSAPVHINHTETDIHFPQLQSLRFDGAIFLMDALKSLSNLRKLYISESFGGLSFYNFLLRCSVLETIELRPLMMKPPYPIDPKPIVLSSLRKLSVQCQPLHEDAMHRFLTSIHTPMLQTLEVDGRYPDESQATLWKLIRNARSSLVHLQFGNMDLSSDQFTRSIQPLTEITSIWITKCTTSVGFWEMLTPDENTAPPQWNLPKLESITHAPAHNSDNLLPEETEAAFVRFVERRAPPVAGGVVSGEGHYLSEVNLG